MEIGQQFQNLDKNIVDKPVFLSDAEGQEYNRQKRIQRSAAWGSPNTMRSEGFWWHTQPRPAESSVDRGVTVLHPQSYNIHGSETHIKTLVSGQRVDPYEEPIGPTLLHIAPPHAHDDIKANGLRPYVTARSGHDSRRFGVFLSRTAGRIDFSGSGGTGSDVWDVKVPKDDLRKGPDGDIYVERRIRPSEISHVGHVCVGAADSHIPVSGRAKDCPMCKGTVYGR
jgi:hypothetical protein